MVGVLVKTALLASFVCVVLPALILRRIRLVRVDGLTGAIYWTVLSWLWDYPVPKDFDAWFGSGKHDEFFQDRDKFIRVWRFLRPFFMSHGYDLYTFQNAADTSGRLFPSPTSVVATEEVSFPYARRLYEDLTQTHFDFSSLRVWPARDKSGRDVVIKAISGPIATRELKALRLLHSDGLKDNPENHTIPVLKYLEFDGQVFIVMPRWDRAISADFVNVGELVRYGQAFFEAVAFLHKNGIGHDDISLQNMSMDLITKNNPPFAGVRGPDRRYAFIDFETAKLIDINSLIDQPTPEVFKWDVHHLATDIEIHLRCIQDVLPELVTLFDAMKDIDSPNQPSAAAALAKYEDICRSLFVEDLERHVEMTRWRDGTLFFFFMDRDFMFALLTSYRKDNI